MDMGQLRSTSPSRQSRILLPILNAGLDEWCRGSELRSSQGGPFGGSGTQAGAHWRASVVRVQAKVEMHCHVLDVGYLDGILDSMC
ncbi:hypothetical protein J1605_021344 [Eschrichtius robustus]|uniref:Uncharacterized protein n=1 Tax=Eschrichtius robustus TaxID=9764 RepID=A0AB34HGK6_ESCRO|nr:hypothetical protein J1605_021344 [Eschrichtius robustus]